MRARTAEPSEMDLGNVRQSQEHKEISAETHQIADQRHCFSPPEVWHAVNTIQSTTHPGEKTYFEHRLYFQLTAGS